MKIYILPLLYNKSEALDMTAQHHNGME